MDIKMHSTQISSRQTVNTTKNTEISRPEPCRVQESFHVPSVALAWAATASSATDASTGYTRNAVGSSTRQRTLITGVHDARELQDHRGQSKSDLTSWRWCFVLLPRRHALSSRWLRTFNNSMCEKRLEEVQTATSSLFLSPLRHVAACTALVCGAQCSMPDLATDKAKPPSSAGEWQGNDQTDLQCQAARYCHHQVQWATWAAWHRVPGPHSEGETWTCGTLQWCSRQPRTYRLMESVGLGGPRWHGSSWQRGITESGSSLGYRPSRVEVLRPSHPNGVMSSTVSLPNHTFTGQA